MLFILEIDPLQKLLQRVTQEETLTPLMRGNTKSCISLYTDAATIFVAPHANELSNLKAILDLFGAAIGLKVNLEKIEVFPVNYQDIDL